MSRVYVVCGTVGRIGLAAVIGIVGFLVFAGLAVAIPSNKPFEVVPGSFHVTSSSQQAGAHEDLTTAFDVAHDGAGETYNDVRNVIVELPVGLVGNDTAVPVCTQTQLLSNGPRGVFQANCPIASQVGTISFIERGAAGETPVTEPLYNMLVTSPGIVAAFGFKTALITQLLNVTVRPGDSGLTVTTPNIEAIVQPRGISVTVWGVPASHAHDSERDRECEAGRCEGGNEQANIPPQPYLTTPTSCSEIPLVAKIKADSWEHPEEWSEQTSEISPMTGCERVPFSPSLVVAPTTSSAESSSGLNVSLVVPQEWSSPNTLSTSNLKDSVIALPEGYTANPSLAAGLGACTPQQYESETYSSLPGEGCPDESKIGTVDVETPVILGGEKLSGVVYIATPYDNPFDSLLALYIVVKNPQLGIIVKLAGRIDANPVTGQLVTTFDNNPQVPFSRFTLKLRQGANSPLVSPPVCGTYTATGTFTPWSQPLVPFPVNSSFQIEHGIGGGPCPAGGTPPFNPAVISGTQSNNAGGYSPFYLRIERRDGEQEITKFSTTMPPGLSGNLTGIPFCPEADIQRAREQTGAQADTEPACPATSEIGHTIVEAGVGSVLAQTPGRVYLAGPYHGASLSIVSVTSAKVGPFDLGTVVIRFALFINSTTAQVEVSGAQSDPIPHIIKGIIVHVRNIHVYIDRSKFIINPTSCEPMSITDAITGAGADPANPADQQTVNVNTRFQAANCADLTFKPIFKASTSGKASRQNGTSLHVTLTYPNAPLGTQANIHYVKVDLPKQLPSRLTTLQKACLDKTFNINPAACPAASRVGTAKAVTPILPVPIEGPAYFVSHGGAKFPELIIVLQGYGITIDLHGETFINKGITSSTFRTVPDQPVTSFELTLPQGPDSAIAANGNLCSASLKMPTSFTAQNGMTIKQNTPITVTGCPRHTHHKPKRHNKRKKK
jgi:hypothetical protein